MREQLAREHPVFIKVFAATFVRLRKTDLLQVCYERGKEHAGSLCRLCRRAPAVSDGQFQCSNAIRSEFQFGDQQMCTPGHPVE